MSVVGQRPGIDEAYQSAPAVRDYLEADRGCPAKSLFEHSTEDLGNAPIPKEHYTSPEWAAREADKLWKHVWQMACRENDIPNVGDQLEYEIVDQSILIVRSAADEIKAYYNVCRHRGNLLIEGSKSACEIKCPFHGWTWDLDGKLKRIHCRHDFPEVRDADYGLTEVKVGRWNGWVFVNLDPDAGSLETYLGDDILRHWESWPRHHAWKAFHIAKVVPSNWKVALEGFLEAYHAPYLHPQMVAYVGDGQAQYDFYGPHQRYIVPFAVPSPFLGEDFDPQATVDAMIGDAFGSGCVPLGPDFEIPQLQPGQQPREVVADVIKGAIRSQTGFDLSAVSDAEVIDSILYAIFPNVQLVGGYGMPLALRFRPTSRTDPDSCIVDIMVLVTMPEDTPLPPDMPMVMTPADESWSKTGMLFGAGPIADQDVSNFGKIQRGLHSDGLPAVTLSNYQERNIRNLHAHLSRYVES